MKRFHPFRLRYTKTDTSPKVYLRKTTPKGCFRIDYQSLYPATGDLYQRGYTIKTIHCIIYYVKKKVKQYSQAQCDKLLSPIIRELHPVCLLNGTNPNCTYNTEVAHHHVHKSKSLALRYFWDNLIPLCNHCHLMLHMNESFWASKIVQIRGLEWFCQLEKKKNEICKPNYNEIYQTLIEKQKKLNLW